jgi:hypothetical protein
MEKFENGIYLIDDTKKNPNLTDIAFAFKNAQLKDAEKFVAIIRGMRFGYDERKRNIYPLKDEQYQVLREPVAELVEVDDDKVVADEPVETPVVENEPETAPVLEEDEVVEDLSTEEETAEIEPVLEEFEPIKEETIVVAEEPERVLVEEIIAEFEKQADELIEKSYEPDELDGETSVQSTAREEELLEQLKAKDEEIATLKVEHARNQRVLQVVLKFNADLINALK